MKRLALQSIPLALTICSGNFTLAAEQAIVLHGVLAKLDGPVFVIKTRYGAPAKFMLGPSPHVVLPKSLT